MGIPNSDYFQKYLKKNAKGIKKAEAKVERLTRRQNNKYSAKRNKKIANTNIEIAQRKIKQNVVEAAEEQIQAAKVSAGKILLLECPVGDAREND
jgi:hypothetical protein